MNKKDLSEQEIRTQYITPAIRAAGWSVSQIREEYAITKGRIIARGGTYKRDSAKYADYILFYRPHLPLAVVEAKDNNHVIGDGMQQAMDYAQRMMIPFVFTSNGDGFTFHNRIDSSEEVISIDDFPAPEMLWEIYKQNNGIDKQREEVISQPYYLEREDKPPRYYQFNAINMTVDAVVRGQNRVLLVMATGTGKHIRRFRLSGVSGKQASKNASCSSRTGMP